MAWKRYSDMSPEEKKASWANFARSSALKKAQNSIPRQHAGNHDDAKKGHKFDSNPGGYCRHCGHGSDHS